MPIKSLLFAFVTAICLLTACKKHGSDIDEKLIEKAKAENPGCACNPYIDKYNWEGKIIYVMGFNGPTCDILPVYYDSNGDQFTFDEAGLREFHKQRVFIKRIWSCDQPQVTTSFEKELIAKTIAENPKCTCDPFIGKYYYRGNIVYMKYVKGPACNGIPSVYGENGEVFDLPKNMTFAEFIAECTIINVVWYCKEAPVTHQ